MGYRLLLTVGVALLTGCSGEWSDPSIDQQSSPIIGGVPSGTGDFPSTGALLISGKMDGRSVSGMVCSASLVAPDVILTAAHCAFVLDELDSGQPYTLYFTTALDVRSFQSGGVPPSDSVRLKNLVTHPKFDPELAMSNTGLMDVHDIAVGVLEYPMTGVEVATLPELDDGDEFEMGSKLWISGYGVRTRESSGPNGVGVKYHAQSLLNLLGSSEMQVGDKDPVPQKCNGDSGGPSFLDMDDGKEPSRRLVGVTSRSFNEQENCQVGGVDTRVDVHMGWIMETLRGFCDSGVRENCAGTDGLVHPHEVIDGGPGGAGGEQGLGGASGGGAGSGLGGADASPGGQAGSQAGGGAAGSGAGNQGTGEASDDSDSGCRVGRTTSMSDSWLVLAMGLGVMGLLGRRRSG